MIKYSFTDNEKFNLFLDSLKGKPTFVLFTDESCQELFNFEIIKSNNEESVIEFKVAPTSLLKNLPSDFFNQNSRTNVSTFGLNYKNIWQNIKFSTVDLLEEQINRTYPIVRTQVIRTKKNIVVGPCQTFEHVQDAYQFAFCDFLDEIEDRITRRVALQIRYWTDRIELIAKMALIVDTTFKDKTEYLVLDSGDVIRLDRVYDIHTI